MDKGNKESNPPTLWGCGKELQSLGLYDTYNSKIWEKNPRRWTASLTLSSNWLLWFQLCAIFPAFFIFPTLFLFPALFYFPRNFECLARVEERRPLLLSLEPKGVDHPPEAQPPGRLPQAHHLNHDGDPQYPNYWVLLYILYIMILDRTL